MLTIIIPTYNRAEYLNKNLSILYQLSITHTFSLIICNNGSTDDTLKVINKWVELMPFAIVVNHEKNLGYDANVASGYRIVKTKYVWILGDSYTFDISKFYEVLEQLNNDKDLLILKVRDNSFNSKTDELTPDLLLKKYGWYLTHLSSFIMKTTFISEFSLKRYVNSYFIHFGILFEGISNLDKCKFKYLDDFLINTIELNLNRDEKSGSWRSNPFPIFGKYWFHLIMSLPNNYSHESKLECIKKHDEITGVLSVHNFLRVILYGHRSDLDYKVLKKYIPFVCASSAWKYYLAMNFFPSIPISLLNFRKNILNIK